MVTLIRTLKRITTSPQSPNNNNKSLQTKAATVATGTDQNFSANHVHHGQLKKTETTANDAIEMSKKERTSSDNTTSPQNSSDEKSAAVNSNEKNTETKFDRKRKASTHEELLPTKKAAVNKNKKICSANGCTNVVVQGGRVCTMHGEKVKRCSREGCTNMSQPKRGGTFSRHWAKFKQCSKDGCTAYAQNGGVCIRHNTHLVQACLAVAGNNPTPSYTELFEASNASEVLDLFRAPAHPTSGSIMAYDPSPLGGIFIGQRNLDRLDQQEHQSMQQQQQCSIPQREYQLKEGMPLPHFGSSQLHCGISTNNAVGRNMFGQDIIPAHRYPTRLSIPTDEKILDPVHNFLRSTCIEAFLSGSEYNSRGRGRGSKSSVGLRCVHCKHVPNLSVKGVCTSTSSQRNAWDRKFNELLDFKQQHGHCDVPQTYAPNPKLGVWVNKQRMEHKNREDGNISTLTDERLERLQSIGFRWAERRGQVRWDEKYDELIQYAAKLGNCHVPTKFKENTALGRWVSTQRAEYKKFRKGEKSSLTAEKIQRLDSIGFAWFMAL